MNWNYNRFKTYGKSLWFRKGRSILVNLTFRCNLSCEYCNMILTTGKIQMHDHDLEFWKAKIENFTTIHKTKEVMVSGGEPTLIPWLPEFLQWLLDKGFHVLVLSNGFKVERLLEVKPHYRLQYSFSYHHDTPYAEMKHKYDILRMRGYRINIKELKDGKPKMFSHSIPAVRHCATAADLLLEDITFPVLNFGANGQLYSGCAAMYEDLAVPKDKQ